MMFGLSQEQWWDEKGWIKGSLQGMHMGWSFTSGFTRNAEDAVKYIREREDLEVVSVYADSLKRSQDEMLSIATQIAKALSEHPHKPWVHIRDPQMDYLKSVFEATGLRVECDILEFVIFERWKSQIPEETAV